MGIISSTYFAYSTADSTTTPPPPTPATAAADGRQQKVTPRKRPKNVLPLLGNGKFRVGCADIMISDSADCSGAPAEETIGIFARIFYPAIHVPETVPSTDYIPWKPEAEYVEGLANYREMSTRKMNFFMDWVLGDKRVPVQWQLPLAANGDRFPVVVFSHGISGNRFFYSTFCASLASHGFVVAALEHRDGSSCYTYELQRNSEGQLERKPVEMRKLPHTEEEYAMRIDQVRQRVVESLRMLNLFGNLDSGLDQQSNVQILLGADFDWKQFEGRLDVDNAISVGHSFGGASAVTICALDKRIKACVILDGWLFPFERKYYAGVSQPVLMLNASNWQWPINVKRLKHLQKQGGGVGKQMFTMSDIVHQTFSDFGLLLPGRVGKYFGLQGELDPEYTGQAIMEMTTEFLQNPAESAEKLRDIIASKQYGKFMREGTDISDEDLSKIDVELEEDGQEEERKIAEGGEVDAQEAK